MNGVEFSAGVIVIGILVYRSLLDWFDDRRANREREEMDPHTRHRVEGMVREAWRDLEQEEDEK